MKLVSIAEVHVRLKSPSKAIYRTRLLCYGLFFSKTITLWIDP